MSQDLIKIKLEDVFLKDISKRARCHYLVILRKNLKNSDRLSKSNSF